MCCDFDQEGVGGRVAVVESQSGRVMMLCRSAASATPSSEKLVGTREPVRYMRGALESLGHCVE